MPIQRLGALNNLGTGVQVGNRLNGGTLELRTLVAKDGVALVQNENDIYIYGAPSEATFPVFDKKVVALIGISKLQEFM